MFKILVIFAFASVALAQTPVKSCGHGKPQPKAVYFGGKESFCMKPPCIIKRGKIASTEVEFVSPINSQTVMPKAMTRVFGLEMDLNLGIKPAATCSLLEKGCPLAKGDRTSLKIVKTVEMETRVGTAEVEYSLLGDNQQVIFCYKLKTTVK